MTISTLNNTTVTFHDLSFADVLIKIVDDTVYKNK